MAIREATHDNLVEVSTRVRVRNASAGRRVIRNITSIISAIITVVKRRFVREAPL